MSNATDTGKTITALVRQGAVLRPEVLLMGHRDRQGRVCPDEYPWPAGVSTGDCQVLALYLLPGKIHATVDSVRVRSFVRFGLAALCRQSLGGREQCFLWAVREEREVTTPLTAFRLPAGSEAPGFQAFTHLREWDCRIRPAGSCLQVVVTAEVQVSLAREEEVAVLPVVSEGELGRKWPQILEPETKAGKAHSAGLWGDWGSDAAEGVNLPLDRLPRPLLAAMEAAVRQALLAEAAAGSAEVTAAAEKRDGTVASRPEGRPTKVGKEAPAGWRGERPARMGGRQTILEGGKPMAFQLFTPDSAAKKLAEELQTANRNLEDQQAQYDRLTQEKEMLQVCLQDTVIGKNALQAENGTLMAEIEALRVGDEALRAENETLRAEMAALQQALDVKAREAAALQGQLAAAAATKPGPGESDGPFSWFRRHTVTRNQ